MHYDRIFLANKNEIDSCSFIIFKTSMLAKLDLGKHKQIYRIVMFLFVNPKINYDKKVFSDVEKKMVY